MLSSYGVGALNLEEPQISFKESPGTTLEKDLLASLLVLGRKHVLKIFVMILLFNSSQLEVTFFFTFVIFFGM